VLRDLFEQKLTTKNDLPMIEQFTRVVSASSGETVVRAWPPVSLHAVLSNCSVSNGTSVPDARAAASLLEALKSQQLESGRCWEIVFLCAILLRVHHLVLRDDATRERRDFIFETICGKKVSILPDGLLQCLCSRTRTRTKLNLHVFVENPEESDVDAILLKIRGYEPESYPAAVFWNPTHSRLNLLDSFVVFYEKDKQPEVCGYQMKAGDAYPTNDPKGGVRYFVVRGSEKGVGASNAAKKGWIVVPPDFCRKLLGPTFAPLLEFEYGLPGGKAKSPTAPPTSSS